MKRIVLPAFLLLLFACGDRTQTTPTQEAASRDASQIEDANEDMPSKVADTADGFAVDSMSVPAKVEQAKKKSSPNN